MRIRIFFNALLAMLMTVAGSTTVYAQAVSGQGTWESTLLGRDINLNAVAATSADAVYLYDTTLNVTWLRNANVAGQMDWNTATTWAANLVTGSGATAISDWRLPTMADPNAVTNWTYGGTNAGYNPDPSSSEMASLFFNSLGNKAYYDTKGNPQPGWGLTNTGSFLSLQSAYYWLGTQYVISPSNAWMFSTSNGGQTDNGNTNQFFATAVHSGDVGSVVSAVPEPETYAMLLAGLGLMAFTLRSRRGVSANVPLPRFKDQGRDATGVPII